MKRSLKRIVKLAKESLEPDTSTLEGLSTYLKTWYVLKFNTTYKDPVLLKHNLAELLHLYYVYQINEQPELVEEILNPASQSYEDWLKEQMGDDYVSEDEMVNKMVEYTRKEKELVDSLPETIETDFSMLGED